MPRTNYELHSLKSLRILQERLQLLEMVLAGCIQQLESANVQQIDTLHNITMEKGIAQLATFITRLQSTVISETTKQRMDAVREGEEVPKSQQKPKSTRRRRVAASN